MISGVVSSDLQSDTFSWNALFSSLALAEKAAANECQKISDQFSREGLVDLANEYEDLAYEEIRHCELAHSVARKIVPITARAKSVYSGELFTKDASVLERMTSVHLVFEPAALAFLGYVSSHSKSLVADEKWAKEITTAFNQILRDEVSHVMNGSKAIQKFWSVANDEEKVASLRTMKKHRAFLIAGLKSFFKNNDSKKEFVKTMLDRFDFYYERALKGAFHEESTKVAS
jgi:uncharacterized ferritin-like protein (DUF455 family)